VHDGNPVEMLSTPPGERFREFLQHVH